MSFKKINIQPNPPRDISKAKFSFGSGTLLSRFMGYFFMLSGLLMSIMLIFVWDLPNGAYIFGFAFLIGLLLVLGNRKKIAARKLVYTHGLVCSGVVKSHSRKFNPFRSKPNYVVTLKLDRSEGVNKKRYKMVHPKEGIWNVANVNDQIFGLVHEGKYLFGPEVERIFEIEY